VVRSCACEDGCPLCVGAAEMEGASRKHAALGLLERLLYAA
jgi:ATP-dependent helicase YprA (DUF1998 family)